VTESSEQYSLASDQVMAADTFWSRAGTRIEVSSRHTLKLCSCRSLPVAQCTKLWRSLEARAALVAVLNLCVPVLSVVSWTDWFRGRRAHHQLFLISALTVSAHSTESVLLK
jgi:hypothetical protein